MIILNTPSRTLTSLVTFLNPAQVSSDEVGKMPLRTDENNSVLTTLDAKRINPSLGSLLLTGSTCDCANELDTIDETILVRVEQVEQTG